MNEWNASSSTRVPGHPSRVIASIASPLARRTPAGSRVRGSTAPSTSSPSGSRLGRCEWRSPRAWRRSFGPSHARVNSRHRPIRRGVRGRRRAIRGRCGDDARREVPLETFAGRSKSRWSPSSPSSLSHDPSIEAAPAHRVAMRWPSTRRRGDRVDATVAVAAVLFASTRFALASSPLVARRRGAHRIYLIFEILDILAIALASSRPRSPARLASRSASRRKAKSRVIPPRSDPFVIRHVQPRVLLRHRDRRPARGSHRDDRASSLARARTRRAPDARDVRSHRRRSPPRGDY